MVKIGEAGDLVTWLRCGWFRGGGWSCGHCVGDRCYGCWCIWLALQLGSALAGLIRWIRIKWENGLLSGKPGVLQEGASLAGGPWLVRLWDFRLGVVDEWLGFLP